MPDNPPDDTPTITEPHNKLIEKLEADEYKRLCKHSCEFVFQAIKTSASDPEVAPNGFQSEQIDEAILLCKTCSFFRECKFEY